MVPSLEMQGGTILFTLCEALCVYLQHLLHLPAGQDGCKWSLAQGVHVLTPICFLKNL